MAQLTDLGKALVNLEKDRVHAIVEDRLKARISPLVIVKELNEGMIEVGERFASCEYFISELIYSSHIMKEAMARVEPVFERTD